MGHFFCEKESGDLFWINQILDCGVDVDQPMDKIFFFIFTPGLNCHTELTVVRIRFDYQKNCEAIINPFLFLS